jgi:8-oxo-dGTP pyrophosphatase MutT (NUDIX family)
VASSDTTARTRQLMRALKAANTGPAAMNSGGFSAITTPAVSPGPSPLVASYGEWTSGRASGTRYSLPRDGATFLSGMFGPLAPIQTVPVDTPQPGEDRPEPRRFQYPVGWNMPMGMPGTEGLGKLADFQTLRTLADLYSVARACIELRKSELRGIGWDIVMTKDAAKANRGDAKGMADFAERRAQAKKFFNRPDPEYSDFSSWFDCLLEEVFVTDALALYMQPALGKKGKGVLGSDLAALDLIDGSLIRPLVDIRGGRPNPPNPAYQQYEYGVPRVDLMTLLLGEDNPDEAKLTAEYRGDQLMYLPYSQRTWTPYGQAPIERAIIPVMTGLNKQQYQLNFFQEGSIPGLFVSPGDPNMTPAQIRELQDALNALAGDQAWKHKIIVLPGGSKVDPQKPVSLADQFDEIVMTQVCMAFSVMPMELGISPKVSSTQSTGAANQMAKASQDIQERRGTVPLLLWLKAAVFDRVIQGVCGQDDMEWQWEGLEEDEDAETLSNLLVQQIGSGLRSIDEGRQELGLDPWGLPITSDPGWATQMGGFVSFTVPPPAPPALPGQPPAPGGAQPPGAKPPAPAGQQPPAQPAKPAPAKPAQPAVPAAGQPRSALAAPASTPAHAAARAAPDSTTAKPTGSTSGSSRSKAQNRELDLLAGYLRKGGHPAGWTFRTLPGHVAAIIAEDLGKGLTADEVIGAARVILGKDDPAEPAAAGLAVVSAQSGRVLMLQRANDPADPAGGTWEFPGGRIEPGETTMDAACREWQEETGHALPEWGVHVTGWASGNGVYAGHVMVVPDEGHVDLTARGQVINPDDPDGDWFEALAWRDPGVIGTTPDVRAELHMDARRVTAAIEAALLPRGRGLPAVKGAADLADPNPVEAQHVINQMLGNYPADCLGWMSKARWIGPVQIPQDRIDDDDMDKWAAAHQPARVDHFADKIRAGEPVRPAVCVQEPGETKVKVIDGHHRTLAWRKTGHPVTAYVGFVKTDGGPWDETHAYQRHQGDDPQNKDSGAGWRPKVTVTAWAHDEALADRFAAELAAELRAVISTRALARTWIARSGLKARKRSRGAAFAWLSTTAVGAAITAVVMKILARLWAEGFRLGTGSAADLYRQAGENPRSVTPQEAETALAAVMASGSKRVQAIVNARLEQLAAILAAGVTLDGDDDEDAPGTGDGLPGADGLEQDLEDCLGSESDAKGITQTEMTFGIAAGLLAGYAAAKTQWVMWLTERDDRVCAACLANQGAGFTLLSRPFPSGDLAPPAHVRCRCALIPGDIGGAALSWARQQLGI